ncbi:hypothetical protein [Enterocloster bolteae]|uniref:hypothetical protein n=1 Tax=Enterocloster bolteae TaxID=208479 RepID=UPI00189FB2DE|nr:hypothetical protein [Enterocloster bolteae]
MKAINLSTIRKRLMEYRTFFYCLFFMPQVFCVSIGLGSGDFLYRVIFFIGMMGIFLSIVCCDYSKKEMAVMLCICGLVLIAFLKNHNRSLLLACLAVFASKNLDYDRILGFAWIIMVICIPLVICLSAVGIIPNVSVSLPKGDETYKIYSFGYSTANNLYFHLWIVAALTFMRFEEKMNVAVVACITGAMFVARLVLHSRTGWICYLLFLIMFYLVKSPVFHSKVNKLFVSLPIICSGINLLLVWLHGYGYGIGVRADKLMTGRLNWSFKAVCDYGISLTGSRGAGQLDSLYMTMLLNYGVILFVVLLYAYTRTMRQMLYKKKHIAVIAMGGLCVYSIMEVNAINPIWNPFLLYIGGSVFQESEQQVGKALRV